MRKLLLSSVLLLLVLFAACSPGGEEEETGTSAELSGTATAAVETTTNVAEATITEPTETEPTVTTAAFELPLSEADAQRVLVSVKPQRKGGGNCIYFVIELLKFRF